MRKAAEEYSDTILAKLREYEFNPEVMRLTVMGGGACILKHFWNGENCHVQYLFQSPNKEQPFDPKHYRDKFKDYIEALGDVRVLTPHSCRHTYVSQMQALGVDLATIQSMVGHADLDMTQHYLHVQSPIKQKAVEAFNAAFCGNDSHSSQIPVSPK